LKAHDTGESDAFGTSVALDQEQILVGAPQDDPFGLSAAGSAYVFANHGGAWTQEAMILPQLMRADAHFGASVQVSGSWALVGASGIFLAPYPSAVNLYHRAESGWSQQLQIDDYSTVRLDGTTFAVSRNENSIGIHSLPPGPISTYCTAKVNSKGCVPGIDFMGAPSAGGSCSFWVTAHNVVNAKVGLLFCSTNGPAALPFSGGFLCVQAPGIRAASQFSGGSPPPADDCSGTYAFDFAAWNDALGGPGFQAGIEVCAQYWYRDPDSLGECGLTNALRFTLWP